LGPVTREVRGQVFDSSGQPAKGALVSLLADSRESPEVLYRLGHSRPWVQAYAVNGKAETPTDDQGRFSLKAVRPGTWRVGASFGRHEGAKTESFKLKAGEEFDLGGIRLERCARENCVDCLTPSAASRPAGQDARLSAPYAQPTAILDTDQVAEGKRFLIGRVTLQGIGVENAWITCWSEFLSAPTRSQKPIASARSDEQGRFAIHLPEAWCSVRATWESEGSVAYGAWKSTVAVDATTSIESDIVLQPAGGIAGRIDVSQTESMVGTRVRATHPSHPPRSTIVGADNTFTFHNLRPGTWNLIHNIFSFDRFLPAEEGLDVRVNSGQTASAVFELAGENPCHVTGRFLVDGESLGANWQQTLQLDGRSLTGGTGMAANGELVLGPFRAGELRWSALNWGVAFECYAQTIQLLPGSNDLQADVPTGSLSLAFLPLPNESAPPMEVPIDCALTWSSDSGLTWYGGLSKADDGRLTIERVPVGTVQLRYAPVGESVDPQAHPVVAEIEVRRGETVHLDCPPR
jgi:hypothetical protein